MVVTKAAIRRLTKEYKVIQQSPPPFIVAKPLESNILEWHYVITGPPETPYSGGQYHGKLIFPSEYPFKPPSIMMITPSGRFETNTKLCLSISDFHPDTWNPAWSVSTILNGLLSFMNSSDITTGSIETSDNEKRRLAKLSHKFNAGNRKFIIVYPELKEQYDAMGPQPGLSADSVEIEPAVEKVSEQMNQNYFLLLTIALVASLMIYVYLIKS